MGKGVSLKKERATFGLELERERATIKIWGVVPGAELFFLQCSGSGATFYRERVIFCSSATASVGAERGARYIQKERVTFCFGAGV